VKGVALGRWLYPDEAERPLRDVDLLIRRSTFTTCRKEVQEQGWPLFYASAEMGELGFFVHDFPVELHAEFGRAGTTSLTTAEVIDRARPGELAGVAVKRIDDVDHLLLLAVNVVKDGFSWGPHHQAQDLELLLSRLRDEGRVEDLFRRVREARFETGLYNVAAWMVEDRFSQSYGVVQDRMRPRRSHATLTRWLRSRPRHHPQVNLLLACLTNDRLSVRSHATARLLKRGLYRSLRLEPP
jgi:hypothetical protein